MGPGKNNINFFKQTTRKGYWAFLIIPEGPKKKGPKRVPKENFFGKLMGEKEGLKGTPNLGL